MHTLTPDELYQLACELPASSIKELPHHTILAILDLAFAMNDEALCRKVINAMG